MRFKNMDILYHNLYKWLTTKTPGERSNKSRFKHYQEELWNPVLKIIDEISKDENPTDKEKEVVFSMKEDNIKEIVIVDNNKLTEWETEGKTLERHKWKRNNMK